MARLGRGLTFGFPRMHRESAERRDFLPDLVGAVAGICASVAVEEGIGSAMGLADADYTSRSRSIRIASNEEAFAQDVVLILRAPEGRFGLLRPGATLIAMLHFPTRPGRVRQLLELGMDAISLDSIADDQGRRLVENCRAVAWNGLDAAFDVLARTYSAFADPGRGPIRVTIMGAGAIGKHAVEAATKYGSLERDAGCAAAGLPGIEVVTMGRNLTARADHLRDRLAVTDVLVDATQRHDPSQPIVPNRLLAVLPRHAVVCDLVVDPYILDADPPTVRAIEGIPQGDLDRFAFAPEDPGWDRTVPTEVDSSARRTVVSCYSWPGVRPRECMERYGIQLDPLLRAMIGRGGSAGLRSNGDYHERAMHRARLRTWTGAARHAAA